MPLTEHLEDVAERASSPAVIPPEKETTYGNATSELVARLGWIHDLGKATTWFQQHIGVRDGDPSGNPTHHAPLGALLAYYTLDVTDHVPEECLAGYVAVGTHHGQLPDVADYVYARTTWSGEAARTGPQRDVVEQIRDIHEHVPDLAGEIVSEATGGAGSWRDFVERIDTKELFHDVKADVTYCGNAGDKRALTESLYPTLLQCWSGLTLADKTSAAHLPREEYDPPRPDRSTLRAYIEGLGSGAAADRERRLNELRSAAREDVLESVEAFTESDTDLATLTLPTGLGKTLTGLDAAMTIRDETDADRIVYALPFTSIIDQVSEVIESVFEITPQDRALTVDHHLEETVTKIVDDEETDEHAAIEEMLGESWRSGLVVTTFVQFFESLAGPKNSQSLKLPALYDSVIVLDEPQGLPHDWWKLVDYLARLLTEDYDATVIAMTATQPELFGSDSRELVGDRERYFRAVDRVEYTFHESAASFSGDDTAISHEQAAADLEAAVTDGQSTLAICNTIDSARALTEELERRIGGVDLGTIYAELLDGDGRPTPETLADAVAKRDGHIRGHLTTRHRPADRLRAIEAIKLLRERDVPLAVVSTQLVEAGVDVSFDRVYRDLAPIDSIVQAAGRCNRSFERDRGTVTVWWLEPTPGTETTPAEAVYERWGDSLISETVNTLRSLGLFEADGGPGDGVAAANVSPDAVEAYYETLRAERDIGKAEYVELLEDAQCAEAGALSLIDEKPAVDVVVCRTAEDRVLIDSIKEAWAQTEYDELRSLIQETKPLQVSVPAYDDSEAEKIEGLLRVHVDSELRWMPVDRFAEWFDETTGVEVPDSTVEGRFL